MKATRLPIGMSPLATRCPPNQITATLEPFMISISAGSISAISRFTRRVVSVRSSLATSNLRSSCCVRTKARITRMPVSFSRSTRLTSSILNCITRNSGTARAMRTPSTIAISGTIASSSADRTTSCRMAMNTPPISIIGAVIMMASAITVISWTC